MDSVAHQRVNEAKAATILNEEPLIDEMRAS